MASAMVSAHIRQMVNANARWPRCRLYVARQGAVKLAAKVRWGAVSSVSGNDDATSASWLACAAGWFQCGYVKQAVNAIAACRGGSTLVPALSEGLSREPVEGPSAHHSSPAAIHTCDCPCQSFAVQTTVACACA